VIAWSTFTIVVLNIARNNMKKLTADLEHIFPNEHLMKALNFGFFANFIAWQLA
jgi:hypothetical protein